MPSAATGGPAGPWAPSAVIIAGAMWAGMDGAWKCPCGGGSDGVYNSHVLCLSVSFLARVYHRLLYNHSGGGRWCLTRDRVTAGYGHGDSTGRHRVHVLTGNIVK